MKNPDRDAKVVTEILIGGLVGVGLIAIYFALHKKETSLGTIGKTLSNAGEILENHEVNEPVPMNTIGKTIHQHEGTIEGVVDWIATGISLWKKFKN